MYYSKRKRKRLLHPPPPQWRPGIGKRSVKALRQMPDQNPRTYTRLGLNKNIKIAKIVNALLRPAVLC